MWRHPGRWGALIAFTGGSSSGPPARPGRRAAIWLGTPVLLTTSDVDAWVPLDRVKADLATVSPGDGRRGRRAAVYPGMDHVVSDDEIALARPLLERIRA